MAKTELPKTISMGSVKDANDDLALVDYSKFNTSDNPMSLAPSIGVSSGAFAAAEKLLKQEAIRNGRSLVSGRTVEESGIFIDNNATSEMERLIQSSGLYKPTSEEWYNKFSRFQTMNPWRRLNLTKEYLFFTKPDLRIFRASGDTYLTNDKKTKDDNTTVLHPNNTHNIPFFKEMYLHYPYVLEQLQYSIDRMHPFMNLLSNAKRSNLELADVQASADIDSPSNIFNTKISYRGTSYSSDDGYDFTIDFEDSKYLEIYRFLKAYDIYENRKHMGLIAIPDQYVADKILHDQFSIYKFIVDEDYSTLIYWAKLTGCYIKSVPRTTFSDLSADGGLTYTVSFRCSFIEDMTPEILMDFNAVASLSKTSFDTECSLYDRTIASSDPTWCDYPYIVYKDGMLSKNKSMDQIAKDVNNTNINLRPRLIWMKSPTGQTTQSLFS